jgi:hypothetical protein
MGNKCTLSLTPAQLKQFKALSKQYNGDTPKVMEEIRRGLAERRKQATGSGTPAGPKGEPPTAKNKWIEDLPPSAIASVQKGVMKAKNDKKLEGSALLEEFQAIILRASKGLSARYWDAPEVEKAIMEHLQFNVLKPVLDGLRKDGLDIMSNEVVIANLTAKMAALRGVSTDEMANIMQQHTSDLYEGGLMLMSMEIRLKDHNLQTISTMNALQTAKQGTNPALTEKLTAKFLSQVADMARYTQAAYGFQTASGRVLQQQRLAQSSVDMMSSKEIKTILDAVNTNPDKAAKKVDSLIENYSRAQGDIQAQAKIAKAFFEYKGVEKFMASMLEAWRGMLLLSWTTNVVNMASGVGETFLIPVERMLGASPLHFRNVQFKDGGLSWDPAAKQAYDEAWHHILNLREGFSHATTAAWYALKHERQALDPYKGAMIELPSKGIDGMSHAEMMGSSPHQLTRDNWKLKGPLGTMMDSLGKGFRMSFRFLGAQDELLKQTSYWASLKAKYHRQAMTDVNGGSISRIDALARVENQMKNHFQKDGFTPKIGKDGNLETDAEALLLAQDITHTKPAWDNTIVSGMQKAVHHNPALGLFMPFIRTPSDLINKAYQRTPLIGYFSKRVQEDLKHADPVRRAQARGRQMVGTAVTLGGLVFAQEGKLTGRGPDEPTANKIWRQTHQPNSIMVGDKWVSYNKADPVGMLLGVIANASEAANNQALTEGTDAGDVVGALVLAVTATIGDKSSLRGMVNLTTLFSNQIIGKDEAVHNVLEDHVASWVPSILSQTKGAFEDTTYIKEADGFIEKLMRKSPYHMGELEDRYNWITGERDALPLANSWGLPITPKESDWILQEMGNLRHGFRGPTRSFDGVQLTSKQYADWCNYMGNTELEGKTMLEALGELMGSQLYDYDPQRVYFKEAAGTQEPVQVQMVKIIMQRYKSAAKQRVLLENPQLNPRPIDDLSALIGGN